MRAPVRPARPVLPCMRLTAATSTCAPYRAYIQHKARHLAPHPVRGRNRPSPGALWALQIEPDVPAVAAGIFDDPTDLADAPHAGQSKRQRLRRARLTV